ncbi:MAG: nuclease, partial [Bacteroidota bacterium]
MGFEGEFASYEPLRRLLDSDKVKALESRLRIRKQDESDEQDFESSITHKKDLKESPIQPDLVLAIDGSNIAAKAENGFPGA